jgi:hypothetical protein
MKRKEKRVALALAAVIAVAAAIAAYAIISAKPSKWQVAARLSNSGSQDTTEFVMNNTWRIVWMVNSQSDNLFVLAVYMKKGNSYSPLTDTSEADTNSTQGILPVPNTGTFIIRVVASDETKWTLFIEEFKPSDT